MSQTVSHQEIESKFYVRDLARVAARLGALGATVLVPRQFEHNLRFDDENRTLTSSGQVLRLRRFDDVRMTYKGAGVRIQGALSRTEIELVVDDYNAAKLFIEALGYRAYITYEKYRAIYLLEGRIITLDELPYGHFVEIEAESPSVIGGVAQQLGLRPEAAIPTSYQGLFDRVCKRRGLELKNLSFEAFTGLEISPQDMDVTPADELTA